MRESWTHTRSAAAFSLIEITIAIGIMGFAFVAILGLVPLGLTSFRSTKNGSIGAQISQQIVAEVEVASFTQLTQNQPPGSTMIVPAPGATGQTVRYFDDQGSEVTPTDPTGIYQVNTRVLVGPNFTQSTTGNSVPNADMAQVTIQVAYVPGHVTPTLGANNLWPTTTISGAPASIATFETMVARNF